MFGATNKGNENLDNMDTEIKAAKVFTPGKVPKYTYNNRQAFDLEQKVTKILTQGGRILVLSGPSKTGKTVLIKKVIPKDKRVLIQGSDIKSLDEFTNQILMRLRKVPAESTVIETLTDETNKEIKLSGAGELKLKFWEVFSTAFIANGSLQHSGAIQNQRLNVFKEDPFERMMEYMIENEYVLVVDDFHYIAGELQKTIIQKLKEPLSEELKAAFALIPSRNEVVIEKEPDMRARTKVIKIPEWTEKELGYIFDEGFAMLNATMAEGIRKSIIDNSFTNPHLMQALCAEYTAQTGIKQRHETKQEYIFNEEIIDRVFSEIADEDSFITTLESGHTQRGSQRIQFNVKYLNKTDIVILDTYQIVLLGLGAIASTNEILLTDLICEIEKFDISRVKNDPEKNQNQRPRKGEITNVLKRISEIANENNPRDPVIEFKEKEGKIYMYDSFFSFNLKHKFMQ